MLGAPVWYGVGPLNRYALAASGVTSGVIVVIACCQGGGRAQFPPEKTNLPLVFIQLSCGLL